MARKASESPREQGRQVAQESAVLLGTVTSYLSPIRRLPIPHAYELLRFRTLLFLLAPSISSKTSSPVATAATAAAASWQVYGGAAG